MNPRRNPPPSFSRPPAPPAPPKAQPEIERLKAERDALLVILCRMVDLAEFWINREDRREYSEQQYKTWHALGYGSSTMRDARAAIAKAEGGGNG